MDMPTKDDYCCEDMKKYLNKSCIWETDALKKYFIGWDKFRTKYQEYEFFEADINYCPFCGKIL